MLSFLISTVAFFVAVYFIGRYLDDAGIPKTMTRGVVVFVAAILFAYGVAFIIDAVTGAL